jgi:hypothetical protein
MSALPLVLLDSAPTSDEVTVNNMPLDILDYLSYWSKVAYPKLIARQSRSRWFKRRDRCARCAHE